MDPERRSLIPDLTLNMNDPRLQDILDQLPESIKERSSFKSSFSYFKKKGIARCSSLLAHYDELPNQKRLLAILIFGYAKYDPARRILLQELRSDHSGRSGMAAAAYGKIGGDEPLADLLKELEDPTREAHLSNVLSALVLYGETTRYADICKHLAELIDRGELSGWNLSLAIEALGLSTVHLDRRTSLFKRSTKIIKSFLEYPSRDVAGTVKFALRLLSK